MKCGTHQNYSVWACKKCEEIELHEIPKKSKAEGRLNRKQSEDLILRDVTTMTSKILEILKGVTKGVKKLTVEKKKLKQ